MQRTPDRLARRVTVIQRRFDELRAAQTICPMSRRCCYGNRRGPAIGVQAHPLWISHRFIFDVRHSFDHGPHGRVVRDSRTISRPLSGADRHKFQTRHFSP